MIKYIFAVVLLFLLDHVALSQGYDLEVVISDVDCGNQNTIFDVEMSIGGSVVALTGKLPISRDFTFPTATELAIDIEAIDDIDPGYCVFGQIIKPRIDFRGNSGCVIQTVRVGNPQVTIEATWTPTAFSIVDPTDPPRNVYCADEIIELNVPRNYGNYIWEYRINGTATWNQIFGATGSTLDKNAIEIFGTNISAVYGKPLTFSARFGSCSRTVSNSYTFYQAAPSGFTVNTNPQSSKCVSDGEVILTFPTGSSYSGEELEVEIHNGPKDRPTETYVFLVSGKTEYIFDSTSIPEIIDGKPLKKPLFNNDTGWTIIVTNALTANDNSDEDFVNSCSSYPGEDFDFDPPPTFAFQDAYPIITKPISCNSGNTSGSSSDGSIQVRVSKGKPNYTYKIFRNDTEITSKAVTISDTTHTFTGLGAGDYHVVVLDGCTGSDRSTITSITNKIELREPDVIGIGGTVVNETCYGTPNNGSISPTASGGTDPYSYSYRWSEGLTSTSRNISGLSGSASPGKLYRLTVTEGACSNSKDFRVIEPSAISISGTVTDETCPGTPNNGSIAVDVSGGRGPGTYNYKWSGGSSATTQDLSGISGTVVGTDYTLTVTDKLDNSCSAVSEIFTVHEPSAIVISGSATDAQCIDRYDGSIEITSVTGGTIPYTYSWSNGKSTQDISGLQGSDVSSGISYVLTVTDGASCQKSKTFYVKSPSQISVVAEVTDESCFGDPNDGSIDITGTSGGTGPFTYQWSGGSSATTADIENLSGGPSGITYTLTVTDSNGCANSFDYLIVEPAILLATPDVTSDYNGLSISCNGANDGSIELDISGGTKFSDDDYRYQWSGSSTATTRDLSNIEAGTYHVRVTDVNGCFFDINDIVLTEPTPLTASSIQTDYNGYEVRCQGGSDGAIDVTASGGVAPYSYQWSGSSTDITEDLSNLVSGTYNLTITDANDCSFLLPTVVLDDPDQLTATTSASVVTCFGGNDGSITVTSSGGVSDYQYSIDGGTNYQSENMFLGMIAGQYTVTIKDQNNCEITRDVTVATPNPIAGSIVSTNPVSCNGDSDGQIAISVGGGTGDLSYLWSTGATSVAISDLSAGDYSLLVTDDNGCTNTFDYSLIEPDVLEITSGVISHVSCFGGSDGSIDVTVQGGTLSYAFSWDNGETTQDLDNISIGTYVLSITDARGCTTTASYTVTEPPLLVVSVEQVDNVSCFSGNDGAITLSAIGGASSLYEYSLDGTTWQSTNIISGLIADTYTLYVEDENGCISTTTAVLTEPTLLEVSTMNIVNTTCGFPVGSAESLVTGGTGPYGYSWTDAFSNEVSTDANISNVLSGIYTVEVTDAKGCVESAVAVITNTDGADYTVIDVLPALCHDSADGQATVMINDIVTPYEILWSSGETTATATGLVAGINVVTVTDGNNCDAIQTVMVGAPDALGVSTISEQYPSCNGEMDAVTVIEGTGGTSPYSYTWNNGQIGNTLSGVGTGDYQVTIVDDHACEEVFTITVQETPILEIIVVESRIPTCTSGSDAILEVVGQGGTAPYSYDWGVLGTTVRIEGLSSGDYPITVMDANGCTTSSTLTLLDPPLLDFTLVSESSPTCNGVMNGFVEIAGVNGRAPYTYQWLTGATGNRLSNIAGGYYEVEITDANGCMNTLTVPFAEPDVLAVGIVSQIDPSCHGFSNGQIEVLATGGTAPYFYNWSTGITGELLGDVIAGTYQVDVLDVNGCSTSAAVTLSEPDPLVMSVIDFILPTCYDSDDGIIEIDIAGGTAPYTISWDTGSSDKNITSLIQGEYEVTITDNQGCVLNETISLTGVESIEAAIAVTDPLCYGYADGAITLTTIGGTGELSYQWNDGVTDINRSDLTAGDYSVVITDQNGCTLDLDIALNDPAEIVFDLPDAEICTGGSHRATLDLGSGYTYTWTLDNGFTTTGDLVNLDQTGVYTVVATDENGCFGEDTFTMVTNNDLLQADFLMTTESYVGDTVVIIDISWPLPESVLWGFDESAATVLNSSNDYLELVFNEDGVFQITQDVGLAECAGYLAQEITILKAVDKPDGEGGRVDSNSELLITSLQVFPNPTDGQFSVEVDLSRSASINVSLISATSNRQMFKEQKSGDDYYTLDYSLANRLQPGIYFIVVAAEGELETVRLMVR